MYDGIKTFGELLDYRAATQPDRPVVRFEGEAVTYQALATSSNRFANAMLALGIEKGQNAAIMLDNRPEYLTAWAGMCKAGIVEVPLNVGYKGDLLTFLLNQSECKAIVIQANWIDRLAAVSRDLDTLEHVIIVDEPGECALDRLEVHRFQDLVDAGDPGPTGIPVAPEDVSVILFTSGTTGPSKGVVLTHNANFRVAETVIELMAYTEGEVLFTAFPLFHVNAKYTSVFPTMLVDGELVMHARFSASRFWEITREEGITAFNYMGALLMMLFKQPEQPDDIENPVRRAYGAPAPLQIFQDFEQRFGLQIVEVYGSTELGTATLNTVDDFVVGSCGKAVRHYDVRIHDHNDEPVPSGTQGEIVVRPLEPHVMVEEYYGNPEATLTAFRNLWFHTGDRGYQDENGNFYFVDRMKDCIRRRGENISSWELEKVINSMDAIEEAAVIGVPSELTEEEVLAVVKLKEGETLLPEEILDEVGERMPHFAVPRYVRFIDELPKTPSQRIEKYKLRTEGLDVATWDREEHGYEVKR
jgi:crotonobetaine/carnitine-CoA ligase